MGSSLQYSFQGKKVLVTGGGQGVGREIISRLYEDGAQVFTLEVQPALVDQLRKDFPHIRAEVADVTKWEETQKLIESFGPMDHLVNNAAIAGLTDFLDTSEQQWDKMVNVNLKAAFAVSQAVAKSMIAAGVKGTIVNTSSICAIVSFEKCSVYSITKAGVAILTKCLARELGPHGIRCNTVTPTGINTPMFLSNMGAAKTSEVKEDPVKNPIKRQPLQGQVMLEPGQVAQAVLFLLSPLSSMASGAELVLDGGITSC